jgi:hypothetical protein
MRQLNLGELIYELEKCRPDTQVNYDFGALIPDGFDSYRGYYEQLALGWKEGEHGEIVTVEELLTKAKETELKEFTGYKGGEYVMYRETPLWVANYGRCHGTAIVGVTDNGYQVIINTAHFD